MLIAFRITREFKARCNYTMVKVELMNMTSDNNIINNDKRTRDGPNASVYRILRPKLRFGSMSYVIWRISFGRIFCVGNISVVFTVYVLIQISSELL